MVELQDFGFNLLTYSLFGTLINTVSRCWGIRKQVIAAKDSVESLSLPWLIYSTMMSATAVVYGIHMDKLSLLLYGLLVGCFNISLVSRFWALRQFCPQGFAATVVTSSVVVSMVAMPYKEEFYLAITLTYAAVMLIQPITIWWNKSVGVVELKFLLSMLPGALIWLIYAYASNDPVLKISGPIISGVIVLTITVWFIYREPKTLTS